MSEHRLAFPDVDGMSIILAEDEDGAAVIHIDLDEAEPTGAAMRRLVRVVINGQPCYEHVAYMPAPRFDDNYQSFVDEGDAYAFDPDERPESTTEQALMMNETTTNPSDTHQQLSSTDVLRLLNGRLTYRQLDYWVRVGRIRPSIRDGSGQGGPNQRQWSLRDVEALESICNMLERHESETQRLGSGELWAALHRGSRATAASSGDGDGHHDGDGNGDLRIG